VFQTPEIFKDTLTCNVQ